MGKLNDLDIMENELRKNNGQYIGVRNKIVAFERLDKEDEPWKCKWFHYPRKGSDGWECMYCNKSLPEPKNDRLPRV